MGKKKKISEKVKIYNVVLIAVLIVLIFSLLAVLFAKLFRNTDYYKIEPRTNKIEEARKNDTSNFETIGWVKVQGTNIDYPLYGLINDDYDYPVNESYLWSLNMDRDFHSVMITYGHNIMNLGSQPILKSSTFTRMEELMSYVYYDFAQDNEYFQLTIDGRDYLYKIFAVNFMTVADLNEYPEGEFSTKDKEKYVERIKKESIYDYNVRVNKDDNIMSVVTCTRFFNDGTNYDFILTGRQVKPGEKVDKYKVKRNSNYVKIEELLKGDEENGNKENA